MISLEELKCYLDKKLKNEWAEQPYNEQLKKIQQVLDNYVLTNEQAEYANPIKPVFEEQSNKKTLINAEKAKLIALRVKNKK